MLGDSFRLEAGGSIARFSATGAECRDWRVCGRKMLWPGDIDIWNGIAPLLFPVCGWSRNGEIRVGTESFPMPVHGFAAQSRFDVSYHGSDRIGFHLSDSSATRKNYPFSFSLDVRFALAPLSLSVEIGIENRGETFMPYACGLHPGFVWNHQQGDHAFSFSEVERRETPVIAPGGLFTSRYRPVPLSGRSLALEPSLFAREALCFTDVKSRAFAFECPDGTLSIEAPDFPHLVLWNKDAAPFLAIESWTGTGDRDDAQGDLAERPSIILLPAGARRVHRLAYRWQPALA